MVMSDDRYGRGMAITRHCTVAGVVIAAVLTLAGCGGSTAGAGSAGSSTKPSPTGSDASDDPAGSQAMVVVRTGGFAGVRDLMRVAADGTARITVRTGDTRDCTPSPASLDRLRTIDLVALNATPTKLSRMADGFSYAVQTGDGRAAASEGDDGRRADFVGAAAAAIASCLATRS
jgi:hypothetical protein